jgi:uncharacterized membrane protein YphA (DoxX/SURF4 family)
MTIYSIVGIIAAVALVITALRYFLNRPTNLLIAYLQDFVGAFFIFSGSIKAIDPLGTSYKMTEYFEVFHMSFLDSFATAFAIIMIVLEIVVGLTLILGYKRKLTLALLLLTIIFFTFLTGFTAIFNKVTDCGCFGDFLKLKPFTSFYKDIFLTTLIIILIIGHKHIKQLVSTYISASITVVVLIGSLLFCFYNVLWNEPVIDFRPYKIGNNIPELMIQKPEDRAITAFKFTYKNTKTGETKVFMNAGPEGDEWEFVSREDSVIKEGHDAKIMNFHIENDEGEVMDDEILHNPDYSFMVVAYDLNKTRMQAFDKLNAINEAAEKDGKVFFAVTGSSERDAFRHKVEAAYPFYIGDQTFLKTIMRSNPGLLLLKNGTIVNKWHYRNLPTYEEIKAENFKQ